MPRTEESRSYKLDDSGSDFERRFQEEKARIHRESTSGRMLGPTHQGVFESLTPKQKRWLLGGAILVSTVVAAVGVGHKTLGEGFRKIFSDGAPTKVDKPANANGPGSVKGIEVPDRRHARYGGSLSVDPDQLPEDYRKGLGQIQSNNK